MKICIIGNSHSASVLGALKAGYVLNGAGVDHYVIPGGNEPRLIAGENGAFVATNSRKLRSSVGEALRVEDFDGLLLSAFNFDAPKNDNLRQGRHILGKLQCYEWTSADKKVAQVSRAVFGEVLGNWIRQWGMFRFISSLKAQGYGGRVFVEIAPPPSATLGADPEWLLRLRWGEPTERFFADFLGMCEQAAREIIRESGLKAVILPPPAESREGAFLRPALGRVGDVSHANAVYGKMVLDVLQGCLDEG